MATINCHTCGVEILTYELGDSVPTHVIVAPGAPVPGGNHVVHVCPQQVPYVAQRRPSDVLDWTDEQERAAVAAALPNWELLDDDVIFCMSWFNPGAGRSEVAPAPLTVQVRRAGTDLKYAEQGVHFDEAAFTAVETAALLEQLDLPSWHGLCADLEREELAAAAEAEVRQRRAQAATESAASWRQALVEAQAEVEHTAAHAEADPDDGDAQAAAANAEAMAGHIADSLARAEAEAAEAVAAAQ